MQQIMTPNRCTRRVPLAAILGMVLGGICLLSRSASAQPREHLLDGKPSGWCYPLLDNINTDGLSKTPLECISFGFMSYNNEDWPYHYAQDFTDGYKPGDPVYAMADGNIIMFRKSRSYGGGTPCDSDYNTLLIEHRYRKADGSAGTVYLFYGHLKKMTHLPAGVSDKEVPVRISVAKGTKIAELNDPQCAGQPPHLHLTVMPDELPAGSFFNGYNRTQTAAGRMRGFNCTNNPNGGWSRDWVDENGKQNIPPGDKAFFDTYRAYVADDGDATLPDPLFSRIDLKTPLEEKLALMAVESGLGAYLQQTTWAKVTEFGEQYSLWLKSYRRSEQGSRVNLDLEIELRTPAFVTRGNLLGNTAVSVAYDRSVLSAIRDPKDPALLAAIISQISTEAPAVQPDNHTLQLMAGLYHQARGKQLSPEAALEGLTVAARLVVIVKGLILQQQH